MLVSARRCRLLVPRVGLEQLRSPSGRRVVDSSLREVGAALLGLLFSGWVTAGPLLLGDRMGRHGGTRGLSDPNTGRSPPACFACIWAFSGGRFGGRRRSL